MASRVNFGLKNVHYSTFTYKAGTGYTYDTPKPIPGAVELSLENNSSESPFYADNTVYYNTYSAGTYTGTLTIAKLPDSFATEILGEKSINELGLLAEDNDNHHREFALLFQIENDVNSDKFCLFRCSASRPGLSGATTTETVEPQTVELAFTAIAREGDEKIKIRTTDTTPKGVHDIWFTRVFDGSVINATVAKNAAFTKPGNGDITINFTTTGGAKVTGVKVDGNNLTVNTQYVYTEGQNTVTIKQAYLAALPEGNHEVSIITDKGNYVTLPLEVKPAAAAQA